MVFLWISWRYVNISSPIHVCTIIAYTCRRVNLIQTVLLFCINNYYRNTFINALVIKNNIQNQNFIISKPIMISRFKKILGILYNFIKICIHNIITNVLFTEWVKKNTYIISSWNVLIIILRMLSSFLSQKF